DRADQGADRPAMRRLSSQRRVHISRAARRQELPELRGRPRGELVQPASRRRVLHHHVRRTPRARDGVLAMRYFPLFLDLAGKPVLLVGGGEVAARKFALLKDAGAKISIVAPALSAELRGEHANGTFVHHARGFENGDIEGMWLVVAATDDRAVNAAAAAAANAQRIPCNVVDDRELSSFIMPAIIDRSPV